MLRIGRERLGRRGKSRIFDAGVISIGTLGKIIAIIISIDKWTDPMSW